MLLPQILYYNSMNYTKKFIVMKAKSDGKGLIVLCFTVEYEIGNYIKLTKCFIINQKNYIPF